MLEPPPVPPLPGTVQVEASVELVHEKPAQVVPVPRYLPLQLDEEEAGSHTARLSTEE